MGDDSIFGGDGDDTLIGWSGNDYLRGDAGADYFLFVGATFGTLATPTALGLDNIGSVNALGIDTIIGFTPGTDKIVLDGVGATAGANTAAFTVNIFSLLSATSPLSLSVVTGAGTGAGSAGFLAADTAQGIIVYNKDTGALYYNPDLQVSAATSLLTPFAILEANLVVSPGDFIIV